MPSFQGGSAIADDEVVWAAGIAGAAEVSRAPHLLAPRGQRRACRPSTTSRRRACSTTRAAASRSICRSRAGTSATSRDPRSRAPRDWERSAIRARPPTRATSASRRRRRRSSTGCFESIERDDADRSLAPRGSPRSSRRAARALPLPRAPDGGVLRRAHGAVGPDRDLRDVPGRRRDAAPPAVRLPDGAAAPRRARLRRRRARALGGPSGVAGRARGDRAAARHLRLGRGVRRARPRAEAAHRRVLRRSVRARRGAAPASRCGRRSSRRSTRTARGTASGAARCYRWPWREAERARVAWTVGGSTGVRWPSGRRRGSSRCCGAVLGERSWNSSASSRRTGRATCGRPRSCGCRSSPT